MWQNIQRIDYPKAEEIKVVYEVDEVFQHKFTFKIGTGGEVDRQILALTYDEAVTLQEKLGQAIQDYERVIRGQAMADSQN